MVDMQGINYVRLHLAGVADQNRKALERSFKAITAEMAAKGLLNSGPTIRARLDAMRESGANFIGVAVDGVPEKHRNPVTFALVSEAFGCIWSFSAPDCQDLSL